MINGGDPFVARVEVRGGMAPGIEAPCGPKQCPIHHCDLQGPEQCLVLSTYPWRERRMLVKSHRIAGALAQGQPVFRDKSVWKET